MAARADFAHTLREIAIERGYQILCPPTVVQELTLKATAKASSDQALALTSLICMREWEIKPYDLISIGHGITEQFAHRLIQKRLLPDDEINDGLILAEVALYAEGIPVLVSSDRHLLDIEEDELRSVFEEKDLPYVSVLHPKRLARVLR